MINVNVIKYSLWVIIMIGVISKALGFSQPQEEVSSLPRQINLSGNILYFSIPENFSKDMPADDMIESVNLEDKSIFQDHKKFTLIRRWWDIKGSSFFAKDIGTIMMSIYIKHTPDNSDKNILEPLGFVGAVIDSFNKLNNEKSSVVNYPDFYEAYSIVKINKQNWISYPVENIANNQHDINYAIPVTKNNYIEVSFSFAPNNNVSIREFIEIYGKKHIKNIVQSLSVQYLQNSNVPAVVSQPVNLQKLIEDKFY